MYVIFPADEVVYLSYGRLIVVPANSNSESSQNPIRTNSIPLENNRSTAPLNSFSLNRSKRSIPLEIHPEASRIEGNSGDSQPSTSRSRNPILSDDIITQETTPNCETKSSQKSNSKKRSLKLNFGLLKKSSSKSSEPQSAYTPRVRYSIGHRDQARASTPPSEAFRRYCYVSPPETESCQSFVKQSSFESKKNSPSPVKILPFSSKRSSSSSKTSKPSSLSKEEQESKESSKNSSTSSKSRQGKNSPISFCNSTSEPKRSQSQIERDTRKQPSRKTSASTSLSVDVFYPLSTSREKNLVEPSPEPKLKTRSSSFRLSLRRSKTPEVSSSQPIRPERKKEKKTPKSKINPERKLSFSDFLIVGREKSSELLPEVIVTSNHEQSSKRLEKSPVLNFFRKAPPSPKNLGRDRTPNINRDSGLHETRIEDNPRPSSTGQKHTSGDNLFLKTSSNQPSCDNPIDPDTFSPSLLYPGGTALPVPHYNFLNYPEMYPDDCGDSVI